MQYVGERMVALVGVCRLSAQKPVRTGSEILSTVSFVDLI